MNAYYLEKWNVPIEFLLSLDIVNMFCEKKNAKENMSFNFDM